MEQETSDRIQSRLQQIEAELEKAKFELEKSKVEDFRKEVLTYLETVEKVDIHGRLFAPEAERVRTVILGLLEKDSNSEYNLARQYFTTFKERFQAVENCMRELGASISSFDSMMKIIDSELNTVRN